MRIEIYHELGFVEHGVQYDVGNSDSVLYSGFKRVRRRYPLFR